MSKIQILNHQILRIDGSNSFFEIMSNAFGIDKVQINFRKYDKNKAKGEKFTQTVDIYVNVEEMLVLCNDILSGKIASLADIERKKGASYPNPVWDSMGGISAEKAKEKGLRTDGKALSRVIKLSPGSKQPFVLTAESGAGEQNEKGLIVPRFGTKPDNRVIVALNANQLKQLALLTQMHIASYTTSQYQSGAYLKEFETKN